MMRLIQYIKRIANVVLYALPGRYQQRRIQILEQMYQLSVDALQKTGEPFWLDFGTLLGQFRSNGIIPHDIDIDVAMMESSYEAVKKLKSNMPKGLKFYDTSHNHAGPKIYFSYKGYDFDIFFYQNEGETIRQFVDAKYPNERQSLSKDFVFPLKEVVFLDRKVKVPFNSEKYLGKMYGYLGTGGTRDQVTGLWHGPKEN